MWQTPVSSVSPRNSTPFALELAAGGRDVVDVERDVAVLLGRERPAHAVRIPDAEAGLADPELVLGLRVGAQAERVHVEGAGAVDVTGRHCDEVDVRDHAERLAP